MICCTVNAQNSLTNRYGNSASGMDADRYDRYGNPVDSSAVNDASTIPIGLSSWVIDQRFGNITEIPVDTLQHNFQNTNDTGGLLGHYSYLGNLGAPRLSHIFFDRKETSTFFFLDPYDYAVMHPDNVVYTNTKSPFTNLSYFKHGSSRYGEERFKAYLAMNANKRTGFGFNIDYIYGRGIYQNQSTAMFNGNLFFYHLGDKYNAHFSFINDNLKVAENGGITDDRYITAPEEMAEGRKEYESVNIPTVLNASANRNHDFYVFLTQRYNLGFHRDIPQAENDTMPAKQEFVPVTSFIHTIQVERSRHNFRSDDNVENYYKQTLLDKENTFVRDSTVYIGVKNTIGIALLEGFNKYAKAGLTAFASHKLSKYSLMSLDPLKQDKYNETEIYIGGELTKKQGNFLHYHAIGEVGMAGKAIGQFDVKGDIDLNIPLWKDTVSVIARGEISNKLAPFYMRHYHSKHFWWDDDMDKEFRTRIEGELSIANWGTRLRAVVENIKNYTYFNQQALPEQKGGSLQVVSACFNQDFKVGIFHLDNEVTWQKTSNETVLPLPQLSLYHNFYILAKLAKKVLTVQLGADVRYFTKYNAPAYAPGVQQFHLQPTDDLVEIGGYPIVNVYANLHLKRTRIFAMMYHVNAGMGSANSFLVPHYPINPRLFKIGVSWNFYD